MKTYLLINNIDQWLIKFENPVVDISEDDFDFSDPHQVESSGHGFNNINELRNNGNNGNYGKDGNPNRIETPDENIDMDLNRKDKEDITEMSLRFIRGYQQASNEYRVQMMLGINSENIENMENMENIGKDGTNDTNGAKEEAETIGKAENKEIEETKEIDVIRLDQMIICTMTPAMSYVKADNNIDKVIGVKTYDVYDYNGHKYFEVRDNYYSVYNAIKKGHRINFSITREVATEEFLRKTFNVETIQIKVMKEEA
jgi:hypothetical protein